MKWSIKRFSSTHDTQGFRCGQPRLDGFLKRHALENDRDGLGSTYVAIEEESLKVLGYVTLCSNSVHFEHLPINLPRYPIPTLLIARLAVRKTAQGLGIGTALVLEALRIAEEVADRVGVFAVTVEAKTSEVKAWYRNTFGFVELLDDPLHLFVTVADLRASGIKRSSAGGLGPAVFMIPDLLTLAEVEVST